MTQATFIKELTDLLNQYITSYDIEESYRQEMLALLKNEDDVLSGENTKGHFTASAWVLSHDLTHVLLTQHAKIGKWFQLGGHIETIDSSLFKASLREATEESGIQGLSVDDTFIIDLDKHPIPEYKGIPTHPHYDVTCFFVAPENARIQMNIESTQLEWIPLSEVRALTQDAAIHRMVEKTEKMGVAQVC